MKREKKKKRATVGSSRPFQVFVSVDNKNIIANLTQKHK